MNWTQKSTRRNCFVRGCLHMLNLGLLSTQKKHLFLHLCAPIFSSARLPRDNCFNWWMGPKWLLFSFLTLCHSLSPFINWFDLLTGLDTTPESPMLSEDHFSRGCFKSHSVWLAKITFFTGGVQSVGPDTQRAVVRSLFLQ